MRTIVLLELLLLLLIPSWLFNPEHCLSHLVNNITTFTLTSNIFSNLINQIQTLKLLKQLQQLIPQNTVTLQTIQQRKATSGTTQNTFNFRHQILSTNSTTFGPRPDTNILSFTHINFLPNQATNQTHTKIINKLQLILRQIGLVGHCHQVLCHYCP
jgi:hypothetical protein